MFSSVLIANRGEIACRVARTAKRLGLRTIAVYSEADASALHVRLCDEALAIGPPQAEQSYLSIERLIAAALEAGTDCVHPGYGFLSENAEFAEACARAGIVFIGPPPSAMRAMAEKDRAKALMEKAGVPVVPGYHGERQEPAFLKQKAYEIGYPVMVKAVAGGGGRGLRRVDRHVDFEIALEAAQREAFSAFGDDRVLIEKCVAAPRHIEVQVFADVHGHAVHLGERDCSLQRRHQKVIEEAPAPGMTPILREALGAAAVRAAQAVGYTGAGTIEFIADTSDGLRADRIWFMEMNTRLQVEHPVTETVTGLDLVEWQFRIAAGEPLPLAQGDVEIRGHAVEARLYAEDPARDFLPSAGRVLALSLPTDEGVRVDTGVEAGDTISSHYDPMIAKVIARGDTREQALARLTEAMEASVVAGPATNTAFLAAVCHATDYVAGAVDTGFIDRNVSALVPRGMDRAAAARGIVALIQRDRAWSLRCSPDGDKPASPWDATDGFQLSGRRQLRLPFLVDGEPVEAGVMFGADGLAVEVDGAAGDPEAPAFDDGDAVIVVRSGRQTRVRLRGVETSAGHSGEADGTVRAPMHGKLLAVLVEVGQTVAPGQRLAIVEAMKMEHALTAPFAGTVSAVPAAPSTQVAEGVPLVVIAPAE